jgi:hypothetical protein
MRASTERSPAKLKSVGLELLRVDRLDYLEIVDPLSLRPLETDARGGRALVAAFVGGTRLIDNVALESVNNNLLLVGIVVVFALNYALVRIPGWERRGVPYWLVQGVNVAAAGFFVFVGMPELEASAISSWPRVRVPRHSQRAARSHDQRADGRGSERGAPKAYEDAIEAGRADAREEMNRP